MYKVEIFIKCMYEHTILQAYGRSYSQSDPINQIQPICTVHHIPYVNHYPLVATHHLNTHALNSQPPDIPSVIEIYVPP